MKTEWLNNAVSNMKSLHLLIIGLVFLILNTGLPPLFTFIKDSKAEAAVAKELGDVSIRMDEVSTVLTDISWNLIILRNGNNNNLTLPSTKYMIATILNSARGNIMEDVHRIIKYNHIDNPDRQELIKSALSYKIKGYYTSDHSAMERFYYHNHQLSEIWDLFSPQHVVDQICDMLFDDIYINDHDQLRIDINDRITNIFRDYNSTAVTHLNRIK